MDGVSCAKKEEAAIAEFSQAVAISSDGRRPVMEAALGHAYAVAGKRAEARPATFGREVH
jgi:hypothetical protein